MKTITKENGKRTCHKKRKLVHQQFGSDLGDIFAEAVGELKIHREVKKLRAENKDIDEMSCDEFKKCYSKWTKYELERLREELIKNNYCYSAFDTDKHKI